MVKKHYFGCKIGEHHKKWKFFTVECGKTVRRELVSDNKNKVTCESCIKLMKKR